MSDSADQVVNYILRQPFNIYISDFPVRVGKKFDYADDQAILHYASNWLALEGALLRHGNPILLRLKIEAQAQYNKDCVSSLTSLQQGDTT